MGAELPVTVSASGYGGFGLLQETLTEGFTLVATALDAATVKVEGQTVTFTLLGVELVTYTVEAPTTEGQYDFSGFLLDMQKQEAITAGASSVPVGPEPTATPTPAHTATPAPSTTPKPTATPKPAATPEPTVTPDPTPTPALQPTSTSAVVPCATPMPSPTATEGPATPAATAAPAAPVVENQEEEGGTPFYLWLPLALLVVALLVAIAVNMRMRR